MPGALEALRASGRAESIVTVGNDMTEHTRRGLIYNVLTMTFAHPIQRLAIDAIAQMQSDLAKETPPAKHLLNFEILGPENI